MSESRLAESNYQRPGVLTRCRASMSVNLTFGSSDVFCMRRGRHKGRHWFLVRPELRKGWHREGES